MDSYKLEKYILGPCVIHSGTNELEINEQKVKLTPKEMGVLLMLFTNLDTTVTRKDLLNSVWGDLYANDQGLTQAVSRLRYIFADCYSIKIRTIPKTGYLLACESTSKATFPRKLKVSIPGLLIIVLILIIGILIFVFPVGIRINIEENQSHNPAAKELIDG